MNNDLIRRGPLESVAEKLLLGLAEPLDLIRAIMRAPAVDAVEVLRCKDCKWFREWEGSSMGGTCEYWTDVWGMPTAPSGFCSYGERREDNGEIQKETR